MRESSAQDTYESMFVCVFFPVLLCDTMFPVLSKLY